MRSDAACSFWGGIVGFFVVRIPITTNTGLSYSEDDEVIRAWSRSFHTRVEDGDLAGGFGPQDSYWNRIGSHVATYRQT